MLGTFLRRLFQPRAKLLEIGTLAPDFQLKDQLGREVRLSDLRGKTVVLWFYPKADTPGCTKQGCGFRDQSRALEAKGLVVLGVSFDQVPEVQAFAEKFQFPFRLLADPERKAGLAYRACDRASDAYARRITYLIGPDGKLQQALETTDPGGQAAAILALVS